MERLNVHLRFIRPCQNSWPQSMIEKCDPAIGTSSTFHSKTQYECEMSQISSLVISPNRVIVRLTEDRKSSGTEGTQFLQGRVVDEAGLGSWIDWNRSASCHFLLWTSYQWEYWPRESQLATQADLTNDYNVLSKTIIASSNYGVRYRLDQKKRPTGPEYYPYVNAW